MAKFTKKLAQAICDQIAGSDRTMEEIVKYLKKQGYDMPSANTIQKWAARADDKYKEFAEQYTEAYKVRVNNWVEERDRLSKQEVVIPTPGEIIKKYEIPNDRNGMPDARYVLRLIDLDVKKQENWLKRRIETLTRSLGQIAALYDKRFQRHQQEEEKGGNTAFVMVSYAEVHDKLPNIKDITGEVE